MGPDALENHAPAIGRGKLWSLDHCHFVRIKTRHIVETVDRIAGEKLEEPVFDHLFRSATAFFRRLENEMHRAGETAIGSKRAGSTEQHDGVAIMAAGMHLSRNR